MNVSEFVWQRLSEWGLNRVYGYPGDGVGGGWPARHQHENGNQDQDAGHCFRLSKQEVPL